MSREEPATAAREVHRLLLKACFSKDLAALHRALAGCSADDTVHSGSADGISAIHISPANLSCDVVAALSLPTGPSLGLSPLHAAVLTGFSTGVQLLLAAGAQPDARTGGAAAIKRTVQQYPGTHVKLVPRWWGGLRGGSTALALALDTLELVRRRDCGDRDNRYARFLKGYQQCVQVLLEGGADPLLRADATGPVTVLMSHPRDDLWEAVLRRRLPWLLPCHAAGSGGAGPEQKDSAVASEREASPADCRPGAATVAAARRWLAGLTVGQASDLLCAAAAVGEPEQASELVRLAAPLSPAQAEGMLRALAAWHCYDLSSPQLQLVCDILDACKPSLFASMLASADMAQQGLGDLLWGAAEVPHLGAVQRLLAMGAPLSWDTLLTAVRRAACKRRSEDTPAHQARPSRFVPLMAHGEAGPAGAADEEAAPVQDEHGGAAERPAAAGPVPAGTGAAWPGPGRDPPDARAALEVLQALLQGAAALPQPELGTPEAAVELEGDSCIFAWLATQRTEGSSEDWPPVYSERRLVAAVELLLGAGYKPARLAWAWHLPDGAHEPLLLRDYSPFDEAVAEASTQLARMLRMTVDRPPWSLASHCQFPPAFREAARAVLLAARRRQRMSHAAALASASLSEPASCSSVASVTAAPDWLADLPGNALLVAIGLAAYPLSQWL
ncbi:hypothetical protein ABPG77_003275 [Micractinium sp. CCAP 211/92]